MDPVPEQFLSRNEILDRLKDATGTLQKFEVKFSYLAGSVARQEHEWWSDIDLFVGKPGYLKFDSNEKYKYLSNLNGEMMRQTRLEKLQIQIIETLPLRIKFSVIKEGILVFVEDQDYPWNFKTEVIKSYGDFKIWMDRYYTLKRKDRNEN